MNRRHKDGVDALPPVVRADSCEEAVRLASPGVTFLCPDGVTITFGTKAINPRAFRR